MGQSLFSIGRSSLLTYQQAINISGQNVSNLQNPDYTRQSSVISSNVLNNPSNISVDMSMGVNLDDVKRLRNDLLNGYFRTENNQMTKLETSQSVFEQVEFMFNELGDYSLSNTIDEFWKSWQALQEAPDDLSLRKNVLQDGGFLADSIRQKNEQLTDLAGTINSDIDYEITQINNLLEQLSDVNKNLTKSWIESSSERNQLLDRKDAILDSLSGEMDLQMVNQQDGSVNLYINGTPMFYKDTFRTLDLQADGSIKLSTGEDVTISGGKLSGYIEMRDTTIPKYQQMLSSFASDFINNVNKLHQNGYAKDGTAGLAFFSGTGASDITAAISDPEKVATALATLSSSENMNVTNRTVDSTQVISGQLDVFKTAVDDNGGSGEFTVNGVSITWDANDSIDDIIYRINNPAVAAGDPLPGVTATWNSEIQKIELVRNPFIDTTPASPDITVADVSGNFTAFTYLSTATLNKNAEGSGENALAISQLWSRKTVGSPPSWTLDEEYLSLVNTVAKDKNVLDNLTSNKQALVGNVKLQRGQETTVSLDEELIDIMKYQQSYSACSRLISIADELLTTLIQKTGAGR